MKDLELPGDSTAPAKVIGLTVTPISAIRLDLAWTTNPEPDVGHYNVYRGTTVWICCKHSLLILH